MVEIGGKNALWIERRIVIYVGGVGNVGGEGGRRKICGVTVAGRIEDR